MSDFQTKLRILMERNGITQEALGKELGLSHRAIGGWLSGAKPRKAKLQRLAILFAIPVEVLEDDTQTLPKTATELFSEIGNTVGKLTEYKRKWLDPLYALADELQKKADQQKGEAMALENIAQAIKKVADNTKAGHPPDLDEIIPEITTEINKEK